MTTLRHGRLWLGAAGLALAGVCTVLALGLPLGEREMPGAAVFPLLVGAVLGAISLGVLVEAWRMRDPPRLELPGRADARRIATVLGALLAYVVALPWLGHFLSATLLTALVVRLLRGGPWWQAALIGIAVGAATQIVFVRIFQVPLPRGDLFYGLEWWW